MVYMLVHIGDIYNMEAECKLCKYWDPLYHDDLTNLEGWCKRYPEYIKRKKTDYCGEFTPKIKKEVLQD